MERTDADALAARAALDGFEAAWALGDRRGIYEAALSGWRAWPSPALAELVERAAERFGNAMSASRSQSSWKGRFVERARAAEPYEIAALLRSLQLQQLTRVKLAACLVELPSAPKDPAVGRAALGLAMHSRLGALGSSAWSAIDRKLILWAESSGDARLVEAIAAWLTRLLGAASNEAYSAKLRGWLTHAEEVLRGCVAPPLPASELERAATLAARFDGALPRAKRTATKAAPTELEALERAVMENPSDDGALAVWSDALQRVEDPRGELIALQLAGALDEKGQRRVDKLIAAHWRTWLGPIASVVVPGSVVFERGLFAACTTRALRPTQVSIFSHPRWVTIRRITFGGAGALTATMRQLEEARALPVGALARAERLVFPSLRLLEVKLQQSSSAHSLERTTGMPALRTLVIRADSKNAFLRHTQEGEGPLVFFVSTEPYSALLESPIAAQLEQIQLPLDWLDERWLLPELQRIGSLLRTRAPVLRSVELDAFGLGSLELDLGRGEGVVKSAPAGARSRERARAVIEALGLRFVTPT